MKISTALATNRMGRIALHISCLVRRPRQAAWHYRGIRRELHFPVRIPGALRDYIVLAALILSLT